MDEASLPVVIPHDIGPHTFPVAVRSCNTNHAHVDHARVLLDPALNFCRADLPATHLNEVLFAIDNEDVIFGVNIPNVSAVDPSISKFRVASECFFGGSVVVEVAQHGRRSKDL